MRKIKWFFKEIGLEIGYQLYEFKKWIREQYLYYIKKVDRAFYCQAHIEGKSKCETQCDHCKEYFKPLENG